MVAVAVEVGERSVRVSRSSSGSPSLPPPQQRRARAPSAGASDNRGREEMLAPAVERSAWKGDIGVGRAKTAQERERRGEDERKREVVDGTKPTDDVPRRDGGRRTLALAFSGRMVRYVRTVWCGMVS